MTPDEQRHKDCPVEIRYKPFNGQNKSTPGLFCTCHNKWLKWLTTDDANYAIKELSVPIAKYNLSARKLLG